jgi:hypothetical protein
MFASSFELWDRHDNIVWERRLMPVIALPREFLDAAGKTFALLWVVWLMVGPSPTEVLRFCERVRCIVSDMGTERLIARYPDVLPDMFELMFNVKTTLEPRRFLLPLCVSSPGWQHGWDIVLKRSLASLRFFPTFLDGLRSMVSFFRARMLVDLVCRHVAQTGFPAISEMVQNVTVPSIAEWRWGTLFQACGNIDKVLNTLRTYWNPDLFKNAQDPVKLKKMGASLSSSLWS